MLEKFRTAALLFVTLSAQDMGVVVAEAVDFSDDENIDYCCNKIKYPSQGYSNLLQMCKTLGGTTIKKERFVKDAYCSMKPNNKGAWKYICTRPVEADCIRYY
jgi:hypothetical protein